MGLLRRVAWGWMIIAQVVVASPCAASTHCGTGFGGSGSCVVHCVPSFWDGEFFFACSSGRVVSITIDIASTSVVAAEGQLAQLVLRDGVPIGPPGDAQAVRLFPGLNVLQFDVPRSVVEGQEYFFAIGSDQEFIWNSFWVGLSPFPPVANGSFSTDWTSWAGYGPQYCQFLFDLVIDPPTPVGAVDWGSVKRFYRD